ncbi:hypothetical protein F5148DRAFT_614931 [Russula earlei]|uniref:Uncharacterized protein n=1 Tax=Russula earlei TaxID=71964 RepID=A0ACC0UGQ8_9AGAM|nr:hypothetical protein F5148DRAFT_614931 [Russula earlei]
MNGLLTELVCPFHSTSFRLKVLPTLTAAPSALLSFSNPRSFCSHPFHSFCMPIPLPPFPSFALVMSTAPSAAHDNMRLPAYRGSHLTRFHPYPRTQPFLHEKRFMAMVDCRLSECSNDTLQGVDPILCTIASDDSGNAKNKPEASTVAVGSILRRQKLKTAAGRLSAIVVTLRRMYRGTSVKKTEQELKFELMN